MFFIVTPASENVPIQKLSAGYRQGAVISPKQRALPQQMAHSFLLPCSLCTPATQARCPRGAILQHLAEAIAHPA